MDVVNLPMRDFQTLYYLIYLDTLTGGKKDAMGEAIEEVLENA